MGDEPVGEDEDLDETESNNLTMKKRTWRKLAEQYPHAIGRQEQVRNAVHDALEDSSDADKTD